MYCCLNCFTDHIIIRFISDEGEAGDCDFCGGKDTTIIECSELARYFEPFIQIYENVENIFPTEVLKEYEGDTLGEALCGEFGIFERDDIADGILNAIFQDESGDHISWQFEDSWVIRRSDYYDDGLTERIDHSKVWGNLAAELKTKNRFFFRDQEFEESIAKLLQSLDEIIPIHETLFRTRVSAKGKLYVGEEIGMPPPNSAKAGRANPEGIPYLYLSNDEKTAIQEKTPKPGEALSIGVFKVTNELHVVDLRQISPFSFMESEDFESDIYEIGLLEELSNYLAKPVHSNDKSIEYLPSQFLCELIKHSGFDGVIYRSSLGEKDNVALFAQDRVELHDTYLVVTTSTDLNYRKVIDYRI